MTINFDEAQSVREVLSWASSFLKKREKEVSAATWLFKERFDLNQTDLILKFKEEMSTEAKAQFKQDIEKFVTDYPAQYIIGHEWFYGRKFLVTESTLIPRPETEVWFDQYINKLTDKPLRMVDIGTGSGVLAVSHKLQRPQDSVTGIDISEDALEVAQENAERLEADVSFLKGDLTQPIKKEKFDLIVSNPPYIGEEEWNQMDKSVRQNEPKSALFAEDNGLEIYQRLAEELPPLLKKNGQVFLEIGYKQGQGVVEIFRGVFPESTIEVWQDLSGLDRVIHIY